MAHGLSYIQELTDTQLEDIIRDLKNKSERTKQLMDYDWHVEELERRSNPALTFKRIDILKALNNCDLDGSSEDHYLIEAEMFLKALGF